MLLLRPLLERLLALAVLTSCAVSASAQNLLVNPNFDHDTAGWQLASPPVFDPTRDVDGSPNSGSAMLQVSDSSDSFMCQCVNVEVPSGASFLFGGWFIVPPGQDPTGNAYFVLDVFAQQDCQGQDVGSGETPHILSAFTGWGMIQWIAGVEASGKSVHFCAGGGASQPTSVNFDDVFVKVASPNDCVAFAADKLCLNQSRYSVEATYRTADGVSGTAHAIQVTTESGYLWFFTSDNIEVTVKVIDACALNGTYWVFASGLTNVGLVLTVDDTKTGAQKTYTNPLGQALPIIQDTSAFATCP